MLLSAINAQARAATLLSRMTLAEKIGQMSQFSDGGVVTGPGGTPVNLDEAVTQGNVGSVLNAVGLERIRELQRKAVEESRLGIPLLFGLDVIHGYKTIFPIPLAEACSWNLDAMQRSAHIAATEAAADGQHWTFAPMVDIARDPRWGRIAEGAGEDPWLGSQIAQARVRGFQGSDLAAPDSVLACAKHFAAYGAVTAGRDYNTVDISQRTLLETYLPPYRAAVAAGARTLMSAFTEYDGTPSSTNRYLLNDTLRGKWSFDGFVVSDWTSVHEVVAHGSAVDGKDAAAQATNAGLDMEMQSGDYLANLAALANEGKVSTNAIDNAVLNILRVKFEKGLFDNPYQGLDEKRRAQVTKAPDHVVAARDVARRSIVLLKNQGVLPLTPDSQNGQQKIALVGPLAADRANMLGTWAGQGVGDDCRSVQDAFTERGVDFITAKGCDINSDDRSGFAAAVAVAQQSDVIVAVMGESADMSGEASCRTKPELPGVQRELLAALKATGKPLVLVAMNGRPLTLEWEDQNCDAVVEAWHLGSEAGPAVADVLFGDHNPSGRLVTSFPRSVGQIPLHYDHTNTGRPYDKQNYFTTHYLDAPNDPLYPFGYGLSYSNYEYSPLTLSQPAIGPGDKLTVEVTIRNNSQRAGEETAQLYVRDMVGSVNRPVKQLRGFEKVALDPGQEKKIRFKLSAKDLAFYRKDMSYGAEAGEFKVWVGPHSAAGSEATFRLTDSVTLPEP
jgi:beta-glucosidase